jgi:hypothetical protein
MASKGASIPSRSPRGLPRAWILVAIAIAVAGLECNGAGRFPICKSNAECSESTTGRVCYNLKCVACRYDSDCPSGFTCGGSNECSRISETGEPEDAGAAENKGEGGKGEGWDGTWDQCAADCKDRDCIKACDQKFQK